MHRLTFFNPVFCARRCYLFGVLIASLWLLGGCTSSLFKQTSPDINQSQPSTTSSQASFSYSKAQLQGLRGDASQAKQPAQLALAQAWQLLQQHDPSFQSMLSRRQAAQADEAIGRAGLLPQVHLSYYRARNHGKRVQPDIFGNEVTNDLRYTSSVASVQLEQAVFDRLRWADFERGKALAQLGTVQFEAQQNQAFIQLAELYFDVLHAQGVLDLQTHLHKALQQRLTTLQARQQHNEATQTELDETKARLAIAQADVVQAQNELNSLQQELSLRLGYKPQALAGLQAAANFNALTQPLDYWEALALKNSPFIMLARQRLMVAKADLQRATARFSPTATLFMRGQRSESGDVETLSQKIQRFVIGLSLRIPLFTGGYNTAERARTAAEMQAAQKHLEAAIEQTKAQVIQHYTGINSGRTQIAALLEAKASAEKQLEAQTLSFSYGLASNLDVLNAQDELHTTRVRLLTAQLRFLLAQVFLHTTSQPLSATWLWQFSDQYLENTQNGAVQARSTTH